MLLVCLVQEGIEEWIDGGSTHGQHVQTVVNVAVRSSPLFIQAVVHLWHEQEDPGRQAAHEECQHYRTHRQNYLNHNGMLYLVVNKTSLS